MKSIWILFRLKMVRLIKSIFNISDFTLFTRKLKRNVEKIVYHKTFTAKDVVKVMMDMGMKQGSVVILHCAMNNFYNYRGCAEDLINEIMQAIGPNGTLCMPAYPFDKKNSNKIFDVRSDKTAAGYLAETFRQYPGVKRSLNKLHSVCALGKEAEFLVSEHHLSKTCFDEKSPFYKLGLLEGLSFSLGLPYYYIGTVEHVCESLLAEKLLYYRDKFSKEIQYVYIDKEGYRMYHTMNTGSKVPYIRSRNTKLVDTYFDKDKYGRVRLSNIWINMFDVRYTIHKLEELACDGKTIYTYPTFYR